MAPTPDNEAARLEALRRYRLLDTAPEAAFDDIAALAAYVCQTPIALVVLLDEKRQWFKSRHGLGVTETPREYAFCAYTILTDRPMIVEDAMADARFVDNPLVTGEPLIRFYAAVPLIDPGGHALGTLCAIDRQPRSLAAGQIDALSRLGRQVSDQMELRFVAASLADALDNVRVLSGLLPMCAWCKGVRNDAGYWGRVEDYLRDHAGLKTTHGICPACFDAQLVAAT